MPRITYTGAKPRFIDHIAGSGLAWSPGETLTVSEHVAATLTRYPTFRREEAELDFLYDEDDAHEIEPEEEVDLANEAPLANLDAMTKAQLLQYAHRNFGVELDSGMRKGDLVNAIRLQAGRQAVR